MKTQVISKSVTSEASVGHVEPKVAAKIDVKSVAVIGLGYVGLPLALQARKKGFEVVGIDVSEKKLELIKKGVSPFADEEISNNLKQYPISVTNDASIVKNVSTIVICVPTPVYENFMPNLEPVEGACKAIAPFLKKGHLVVLESTVNPGVSEDVVLPILEKISGLKGGKDFYLSHCPERINPGDKRWAVHNIPRVVGSLDPVGLAKSVAFYEAIIDAPIKPMGSIKEAESVKVVENSFRDINIAFVNELAMSFSKLGIDVVNVINGAATKPFAFMAHYPSCGVGGHCIPVDPYYLIEYAKQKGFEHQFLKLARNINNHMPEFTVEQLTAALKENKLNLKKAKIAVLGLAYKREVGDDRESPSYEIIHILEKKGAHVATFDPFVLQKSTAKSLEEALKGATAVIVPTDHDVFKKLTPALFKKNGITVVVDGKNCLDKQAFEKAGITYKGIGR